MSNKKQNEKEYQNWTETESGGRIKIGQKLKVVDDFIGKKLLQVIKVEEYHDTKKQ